MLFLSRNGRDQQHRLAEREAFGDRETAGLGHHQVGRGHELFHLVGEADGDQPTGHALGQCSERRMRRGIAPRHRDHLKVAAWTGQRQHALDHARQIADTGSARRHQHHLARRVEPEPRHARIARELGRVGLRERRHHRDAGDVDAVGREPACAHAKRDLFGRSEIARHARHDPHVVQVVVGHLQPHRAIDVPACLFAHQQLGRQEVRADHGVGLHALHLAQQRAGAHPFDAATQALRGRAVRRAVGLLMDVRPHLGRTVHELDVPVRVDLAKAARHVLHRVDVRGLKWRLERVGRGRERLRCANVAVAGAHAEDE